MCEEEKEYRQNCLSSYINTHKYDDKITSQHFSEELLVHTPIKRNEANALGGISNLTLQASNALNIVLPNVFPTVDNI